MHDTVTLSVSDYDEGGYDDLCADTTFSLNEIISKGEVPPPSPSPSPSPSFSRSLSP